MNNVIETENLTKYYPCIKSFSEFAKRPFQRRYIRALQDINLSIEGESIIGLLGPNGAGKTTLIKILSTLVHPTSGRAVINGYDVVSQSAQVRRSIGIVMTEERSFYWRLTGRQNLQFFAVLNNLSGDERDRRIQRVIDETELHNESERMFKDYSTGIKQRLAIARGLLCDPDIILLDEPTRSLDPQSAQHLRNFIKEKIVGHNKRTAILATHNMQEAEQLCTHVAIIKDGSLLSQGPVNHLKSRIGGSYYVIKLSTGKKKIKFSTMSAIKEVEELSLSPYLIKIQTDNISSVLEEIISSGGSVEECTKKMLSLEDIFSKVVEV